MRVTIENLDAPGLDALSVIGRDAWALLELHCVGDAGCTPLTHPGPRWSGYVYKLRKRGLRIETITESHGGLFAGHHARYVLRSKVRILALDEYPAEGGNTGE
jgi:hypothetical protein